MELYGESEGHAVSRTNTNKRCNHPYNENYYPIKRSCFCAQSVAWSIEVDGCWWISQRRFIKGVNYTPKTNSATNVGIFLKKKWMEKFCPRMICSRKYGIIACNKGENEICSSYVFITLSLKLTPIFFSFEFGLGNAFLGGSLYEESWKVRK